MGKKEKHYRLDEILKISAQYYVLYGERSNGKSYAVKYRCLERAYKNGEKFVYMRRWLEDIQKNRAESYWDDMEEDDEGNHRILEITEGEYDCISVYRSEIYLANRKEDGKKTRGKLIGRVVVLTGDTHEKSRSFVGYYRIIFEEMVTKSGYLGGEVSTFMSMVSTILRRKEGEVFLIGNTLTKTCPYFREWQLTNVPRQKIGTIDIYKYKNGQYDDDGMEVVITIAVEYCENTRGVTKMIFGNSMITRGEWEVDEKEHLPKPYGAHKRLMSILIDDELEYFVVDILTYERQPFLFIRAVHTYDGKWTDYEKYDIILTDRFNYDKRFMKNLSVCPKLRRFVKWLFDGGKVCYEDNLVGTTFATVMNNRKFW